MCIQLRCFDTLVRKKDRCWNYEDVNNQCFGSRDIELRKDILYY